MLFALAMGLCVVGCNKEEIGLVRPDGGIITPDAKPGMDVQSILGDIGVAGDGTCLSGHCAECGNGKKESGEQCDDGNTDPGDGCSAICKEEVDWTCPEEGKPCLSTVSCGDTHISGDEVCDDGNQEDGDGCSSDCLSVEDGWKCGAAGAGCHPICGDGLVRGNEECDDGNQDPKDGCGVGCKHEYGFACPAQGDKDEGSACHPTVCGDGKPEGDESCDDGNKIPGDGCSPDCKSDPICTGTDGCTSRCGDGLKLSYEECDDGNLRSGDGCSADCKLEEGWKCHVVVEGADGDLTVPIIFRDLIGQNAPATLDPPPHPNFDDLKDLGGSGACTGIVMPTLDPKDRKPIYNDSVTGCRTTNAADFDSWYHDSKYSTMVLDNLTLQRQPEGTFIYDHSAAWSTTLGKWIRPAFFPLDNRGWAAPNGPEVSYLGTCDYDKQDHNFSFTSELRYWFEYHGGEYLDFIGDDDVFVFVNGQLAVDLGGIHNAVEGYVTLDDAKAADFKLEKGKVYEIVLFQAERRETRSSYKLTLGQFTLSHTVCEAQCGDGVVNGNEVCDRGKDNSDDAYGGCTTFCTPGPTCGDGHTDSKFGEECDDGKNNAKYGDTEGCAPGCRKAAYCGDGHTDGAEEQCDDGPDNGKPGSRCNALCNLIPI